MGEFSCIGTGALIANAKLAINQAVKEMAEDFVGQAQAATPVDTGTLEASIHVEGVALGTSGVTATVATGGEASEYAIPVHEGWAPHWIIASSAEALWWPGAAHPVRAVLNPGHAGFKYMSNPLLANRNLYVQAMLRAAAGEF